MTFNNQPINKMYIEVDAYNISDEAARKLTFILNRFNMVLDTDGWYVGTSDHCKSVFNLIIQHEDILSKIKTWIYFNSVNNSKEDCLETYKRCLRKWG